MSDAVAAGVGRGRLRGKDLAHPFHRVRAAEYDASDLESRCRMLRLRLPAHIVFSHHTAALLMGMPLPLSVELDPRIHVAALDPLRPPAIRGVVAHQIRTRGSRVRALRSLPVTSPVLTWCLLAPHLSVPDLVAVGDFLITGRRPLATADQLAAAVRASAGQRGVAQLVRALPLVRRGPRSRPETHARLLYAAAGLPEPDLNLKLYDEDGFFVAMVDFGWRPQRIANEYEGKYHQERGQFRADILRRERVEDIGWRLSRFTGDDIRIRPAETVLRMANRLSLTLTASNVAAAVSFARELVP